GGAPGNGGAPGSMPDAGSVGVAPVSGPCGPAWGPEAGAAGPPAPLPAGGRVSGGVGRLRYSRYQPPSMIAAPRSPAPPTPWPNGTADSAITATTTSRMI